MRLEEILGLDRSQAAFDHEKQEVAIDLRPGETKNDEPRSIILTGDPYEWMKRWAAKTAREYPTCPYFFHKDGQRIISIRYAWEQSDVDPIPRQLLRRADDFFGVLFFLTLPDELAWRQVPK